MIAEECFSGLSKPSLLMRFAVAFSLVERVSTGTLTGSEMAGNLTLVLRFPTANLFESINYLNM